ncbi:hypothetical protein AWB67_06168 [Caballeronia terrestris]|uniref:Uncharacterized protein n=1 Tax=Caballeronia terrestris TaxID=1226301 RepID=A0A158KPC2_9BURK|nr:hypothetical protein AWB67_06168 [Caballeronia terrestris]
MNVRRKALRFFHRLKSEMVIAVRLLRLAAGTNHVDLSGHLKARAEPRFGDACDECVREIARKYGRRL